LIKQQWPGVKVIMLTMHLAFRSSGLAAGADVFLMKGCPVKDLLEAILEDGDQDRGFEPDEEDTHDETRYL
jgi:DNA-binding NarL/FixJ family response regulator